jgi:hypothetical protein
MSYGYPEKTSDIDYRQQIAVAACISARRIHTKYSHSRTRLKTLAKLGDQDVGVTEKKQFPVSGFSCGWNLALGSGKRRLPRKKLRFGGSRIGGVICCAHSRSENEISG